MASDDISALEYIAAAARDPRIRPEQLREFVRDIAAVFGVRPSSSAAIDAWISMWSHSTPKPTAQEGNNVRPFPLTNFRPSTEAPGPPPFPFARSPAPADTASTLATQIIAADRRARGEERPAVERGPPPFQTMAAKSAASLADDIVAAYKKAGGSTDDDDDDKLKDDDPELRGPNQRPLAVATPEAIIAAMKKALGEYNNRNHHHVAADRPRLPSPAELDRLRAIVTKTHAWLDCDAQQFHHAFWASGLIFRTATPCSSRYFSGFVDDACDLLRRYGLPGVDRTSFLAACLGHGDIVWRRGNRDLGVLLEIGLSPTYAGRKCANTWRKLLTGEANLLAPVPPPAHMRQAVERGPARIYEQTGPGWRDVSDATGPLWR